ncbi:MAG: hypothetical protein IT269_06675 [Saprospiraceae bacterium]|nr:hypothetical protein [Saprospiraceae bacterium]
MANQSTSGPLQRFLDIFDPAGVKKYVTQISLILISLLLATRAEKCRDEHKEDRKLREFLVEIQADIEDELQQNKMNLKDCDRDIKCMINFLQYYNHPSPDSLKSAMESIAEVYQRGVFRAFPPNTFEIMVETGDVRLIRDLKLRAELASIFAFRRNVVQPDLASFDLQTQACFEKMGYFFNLTQLMNEYNESFFTDKTAFTKGPHNEVFLLLRNAQLRAFHLDVAIEELEKAQKSLNEFMQK